MDPDALQLIEKIKEGITATNQQLDLYIPAILIVWLLWSLISYTVKKIEKEGIGKGIYFGSLAFFEASLFILLLFTVQWIAVFLLGK